MGAKLPPLPPGATLVRSPRDPWDVLREDGWNASNGYRTDADTARIRAQGYTPAAHSRHLEGDAVDLDHPGMTRAQQVARLHELFGDWHGMAVRDEGHHRHLQLPGWGAAPGTPGTPNSGLPELPDGATLVQRGSLDPGNFHEPAPAAPARNLPPIARGSAEVGGAFQGNTSTPPLIRPQGAPGSPGTVEVLPDDPTGAYAARNGSQRLRSALGGMQSAFDAGETLPQLMARARALGVGLTGEEGARFRGDLVRAVRYRDGHHSGSRFIPGDVERVRPFSDPTDMGEVVVTGSRSGRSAPAPHQATAADLPLYDPRSPLAGGSARAYRPSAVTDPVSDAYGFVAGGGDRYSTADQSQRMRDFLDNPLSPVPFLDAAAEADQRARIAGAEGRYGASVGNQAAALGNTLLAIPIVGRARQGGRLAVDAIRELEGLAARQGLRSDDDLVRVLHQHWDQLTPPTREALTAMRQGANGPEPVTPADMGGLRRFVREFAANESGSIPPPPRGGGEPPMGRFGPIHGPELARDWRAGRERLIADQTGELSGAIQHPQIGPVDIVWGTDTYGLKHIMQDHPEVVDDLPGIVERLPVRTFPRDPGENRFVLEDENYRAIVSPDFHGDEQRWLVTAFERKGPGAQTSRREPLSPDGGSTGAGGPDIGAPGSSGNEAPAIGAEGSPAAYLRDLLQNNPEAANAWRASAEELPPLPPGATLERPAGVGNVPSAARSGDVIPPVRLNPEDVLPIPGNRVDSLAEAQRANPGTVQRVTVPRPETFLEMGTYTHPLSGKPVRFRGPLDAEAFLRSRGGVDDAEGELRHMGVTNAGRAHMPTEARLGPIVRRGGMSLDDAGEALWSAEYFAERPTTAEVLEALRGGRFSRERASWRPDDLETVEGFGNAQTAHHAAQAAEQEGAPLGERVGEPATLDDLRANDPPAIAYEDLPKLSGRTEGGINLDRLNNPAEVSRAVEALEREVARTLPAGARAVQTNAETMALADEMGVSYSDLLKLRRGQPLTPPQAVAFRSLMEATLQRMVKLARNARRSDEDLIAFHRSVDLARLVSAKVTESTREMGRALQALSITANPAGMSARARREFGQIVGGREDIEALGEAIISMVEQGKGPGEITRFAINARRPRLKDKFLQFFYFSQLSGIRTHINNFVGNAVAAGMSNPVQAVAAGIGGARAAGARLLRQERVTDRVFASEIGARIHGMLTGTQQGLSRMAHTMRTGDTLDPLSKIESLQHNPIGGTVGTVLNIPTRALGAMDEFFKGFASGQEIEALAARRAAQEGLRGQTRDQRIAELVSNPSPEMIEQAVDFGRYQTFTRPLGPFGEAVIKGLNDQPLLRVFVPYVRTLTNISKYAVAHSPAAPLLREVRAELMAGGTKRDVAVARILTGSGIGALAAYYADQGVITGGIPRGSDANLMQADGWQPYSIRVGDRYYSYERLAPWSITLGIAADLATYRDYMTDRQQEIGALLLAGHIASRFADENYAGNIADVFGVMERPNQYAAAFFGRTLGNVTPAFISQAAEASDPWQRQARTLLDRVRQRVPGLRETLPVRRDALGRGLENEDGALSLINPMRSSRARNDPMIAEMRRIQVPFGRVQPVYSQGGERTHFNREQFDRYQEIAGQYTRRDLTAMFADPEYRRAAVVQQRRWARSAIAEARRDARADVLSGAAMRLPPLPPGATLVQ